MARPGVDLAALERAQLFGSDIQTSRPRAAERFRATGELRKDWQCAFVVTYIGRAGYTAGCSLDNRFTHHSRRMSEHPPPQEACWPQDVIFTLGHSTLPIEAFLALLQAYGIERLVDIRTIPRSRHNPQFNDTALASSLKARHLQYVHLKALGGLRRPRKDSPNTGWRNGGFRGFAD
jgi:hypothetical protein